VIYQAAKVIMMSIESQQNIESESDNNVQNPLIWPLLSIIKSSEQSWQVHHLATELKLKGLLPDLDKDPNKALFKRNFLLMNALYQLQETLLPEQWLQVQSMNIQLFSSLPADLHAMMHQDDGLRSYYLDWQHFETSSDKIEDLLTGFWGRYHDSFGVKASQLDKAKSLKIFGLDTSASQQDIRRQWRKLALKLHPDRATGDQVKFHEACEAWQVLRES
jgi:DnaJ-domain-containing protein 1